MTSNPALLLSIRPQYVASIFADIVKIPIQSERPRLCFHLADEIAHAPPIRPLDDRRDEARLVERERDRQWANRGRGRSFRRFDGHGAAKRQHDGGETHPATNEARVASQRPPSLRANSPRCVVSAEFWSTQRGKGKERWIVVHQRVQVDGIEVRRK